MIVTRYSFVQIPEYIVIKTYFRKTGLSQVWATEDWIRTTTVFTDRMNRLTYQSLFQNQFH